MKGYNFTERAKKVLALARDEAGRFRHEYVGTEHLLLGLIREDGGVGLIREEKGIAAQILSYVGVTERAARAEALRLLGADQPLDRPEGTSEVAAVTVEIRFTAGTVRRNVFPTIAEAIESLTEWSLPE